ncbi:hypothetical protein FANTH_13449 [Fusarium anthophilum]|uniref:Uncharacterized protein n=1 Tax=Fusarium anthophilum TaxID=48485 RepID=A0A8H4YNW1_9HYPO|nr:hypothetical protein FANTH_13449 [Fusarium anthophilum]
MSFLSCLDGLFPLTRQRKPRTKRDGAIEKGQLNVHDYQQDRSGASQTTTLQQLETPEVSKSWEDITESYVESINAVKPLSCPFSIYSPENGLKCERKEDLRSIEDLIGHLFQCHSRLPYCATCYEAFSNLTLRDNHALSEKCNKRHIADIWIGLNESQKVALKEISSKSDTEREAWKQIWSICLSTQQV